MLIYITIKTPYSISGQIMNILRRGGWTEHITIFLTHWIRISEILPWD